MVKVGEHGDAKADGTPQRPPRNELVGLSHLECGRLAAQCLLQMTDEKLTREGLVETPNRVAKSYSFLFSGYQKTAKSAVGRGVFDAEGGGLVSVSDIEFFSLCEHHLLPFWGTVDIGYFPNAKILGLSKLPRLVDAFSRRVQVQERLTRQIVEAIAEVIEPRAIVVRARAQHMCMMMRGVEKHRSLTRTEHVWGLENLDDHEKKRLFNF